MQKIERVITRETAAFEKGRAIVIVLHPKFVTLRVKGTRESYNLTYDAAFSLAAKQSLSVNGGK